MTPHGLRIVPDGPEPRQDVEDLSLHILADAFADIADLPGMTARKRHEWMGREERARADIQGVPSMDRRARHLTHLARLAERAANDVGLTDEERREWRALHDDALLGLEV